MIDLQNIIPVEKNKDYKVEIIGIGHEGEGVGKVDNFTVFVKEALPGEIVEAKIIKLTKSYGVGKLLRVIEPSKERREPICGIYKRCGGCQLMHTSYESQLELKRNIVTETVKRIGKIDDVLVHPTLGMEQPERYRNKVQLPVGGTGNDIRIGFYAPRSHEIIDTETCYIQNESADIVVKFVRQWIKQNNIETYNEETGKGIVRHIMVRRGFKTKEVMVVLVTNGKKLPHTKELIDLITKNVEGIKGIIQNINTKRSNVILGEENITLWGEPFITDYIGDFRFTISPLSFFQVNPMQTEVLYNKALEYAGLTGSEIVFDAYCGTGTISLFLAQKAKKVYGVEIVPQAIENAIENAKVNGIENAEFIVGESEKVIPDMIKKGIKADVVVVDPPRKGCERELLEAIANMKPERMVYVSCDPGTLARDLGILKELGYAVEEIQPVDMFPMTAHVECCVLLKKAEK